MLPGMRLAVGADEPYPVHAAVLDLLVRRGHEVVRFGAVATGEETSFVAVADQVATAVATGDCEEGVLLCWTGTGVSIAANKHAGIRAALATDAPTAAGARVWNHANVLCLSHRLLTADLAAEILTAWLDTAPGERGAAGVAELRALDQRLRRA